MTIEKDYLKGLLKRKNLFLPFLLASRVSDGKSAYKLSEDLLELMLPFSLAAFKICFLFLALENLVVIYLDAGLFVFILVVV